MTDKAEAMVGKVLAGKYEITGVIGRGGMGTVFKGFDSQLQRDVAIKVLSDDLTSDTEFRRRFRQEGSVVAKLHHPSIVAVFDQIEANHVFAIVMEFIDGESLQVVLDRDSSILERDACLIIAQIARALDVAHRRGVVHRDVKPDNILINREGVAKITDFGIARVTGSTLRTQTGISMGTPKYMSPEQVTGKGIDGRSDLYSLGVCLYQCLTGRTPFDGETPINIATKHLYESPVPPAEINTAIQPATERIILRALAKAKDERFATGDEMAEALEAIWAKPKPVVLGGSGSVSSLDRTQRVPTPSTPQRVARVTPVWPAAEESDNGEEDLPIPAVAHPDASSYPAVEDVPTDPTPNATRTTGRHSMVMWGALLATTVAVVAIAALAIIFGGNGNPTRDDDPSILFPAPPADSLIQPGRDFETARLRAFELSREGRMSDAIAIWKAFSEKHPMYREELVTEYRDRLISRAAPAFDAVLLAERRERRGMAFFIGVPPRPRMAKAYLEGAEELYKSLQRPFARAAQLSILDRDLSATIALATPAQVETSRTLAAEAARRAAQLLESTQSDTEAAPAEVSLGEAIELEPDNFDHWLMLADYFRRVRLPDDARVLYRHIERHAPPTSEPRSRASRALRQL